MTALRAAFKEPMNAAVSLWRIAAKRSTASEERLGKRPPRRGLNGVHA